LVNNSKGRVSDQGFLRGLIELHILTLRHTATGTFRFWVKVF
jgi:hypothetical protein